MIGVPYARAVLRAVWPARRSARPAEAEKLWHDLLRIVFFMVILSVAGEFPRSCHIPPKRRPTDGRPFDSRNEPLRRPCEGILAQTPSYPRHSARQERYSGVGR